MDNPIKKPTDRKWRGHRMGPIGALVLLMVMGLAAWSYSRVAATACDAISSASCSITGIKTTTTAAYIYWKEKNNSGTMQFCYGTTSLSNCTTNVSDRGSSNVYTLTGLSANTKYIFKFYGTFRTWHYTASGSFITDGSTCGGPSTTVTVEGLVLSSSGDSLQGVVATAKTSSTGAVAGVDTSNRSGQYIFDLAAGTYTVSLAYPNYTLPTPITATVVAGTDLKLPNQILTDAFQISGMVSDKKGDSLAGAQVTAYKASDNSVAASAVSDVEGHFEFGLKTGSYVLKFALAKYPTQSVNLTVSKSQEIATVIMDLTTGLGGSRKGPAGRSKSARVKGFDVKGVRKASAEGGNPIRLFPAR